MTKRKLTFVEVEELVRENRYRVGERDWFLSRCIDGRYESKLKVKSQKSKIEPQLEPLAKPGSDIGDLLTIFAARREYGLEIENEKIFKAVLKTVGGWKNFRFHTDNHSLNSNNQISKPKQTPISNYQFLISNSFLGCGHFKQASKEPEAYGLVSEEIEMINDFLKKAIKKGARCTILKGEHLEGAVFIVKSTSWSLLPQLIKKETEIELTEIFIYQKTLDDRRRKILAKNLLSDVKAPFSFDEEYLYQILSQVADDQLLETINRLAKDLPVFEVVIDEEGMFEIKEL